MVAVAVPAVELCAVATATVTATVTATARCFANHGQSLFVAGKPFPFVRGRADACGPNGCTVSLI